VTYSGLNERADAVARAVGPAPEDAIIAVLLPRENWLLYAAQLGVMKAGAAYTCLDPATPDGQITRILSDATPVAVVTDCAGRARLAGLGVSLPRLIDAANPGPGETISPAEHTEQLAYVIYTSGTTGEPKGVLIAHRGIVNLVTANVGYFGLTPEDRVGQCSSPAYDSSVEEAWLAFAVGATLVPLDDATVRLGPDLVPWLRAERVTVLCPPPTLLRVTGCADPPKELPDLRLLYVGGEPLPPDLAARWAAGRWMENGYGPTECTVTVLRGRVRPDHPVTIGVPVSGHTAWVLDEELRPVSDGSPGELCVSGPGLARGYHNRPDRTADKFPTVPGLGRVYRTGDLVRRTESGEYEYLGRIDGQVKLRGYRVELGAVEAALVACPGVRAAGCRVQGQGDAAVLSAHVVASDPDRPPDPDGLRDQLRRTLPAYMVPARFGFLDALPATVGGKLDRAALPDLAGLAQSSPGDEARTPEEDVVARAFAAALHLSGRASVHDDFFLDLGGDSVSAVAAVVALRAAKHDEVTVRDVYESRTAAALARRLRPPHEPVEHPHDEARPQGRPFLSTLVQSLWLLGSASCAGVVAWFLGFGVLPFALDEFGLVGATLLAPLAGVFIAVGYAVAAVALTVLTKRILIGRYTAGRVPVWGGYFTRHWIVVHTARLIPWGLVRGTLFHAAILRLLGAKVGARVHVHAGVDLSAGGWDLLTIGDDVTVCQDAEVRVVDLQDGQLVTGPVTLRDGATIDVHAGLSPGATVGRNGFLTALSWLPPGGHVPDGERWDGVPAGPAGLSPDPEPVRGRALSPAVHGLLVILGRTVAGLLWWLPVVALAVVAESVVPDTAARTITWLSGPSWSGLAVVCLAATLAVPVGVILRGVACRLFGRVRPGTVSQYSLAAIRIGLKSSLVDSANKWLSGALFWPWWLRLAGMRVGRGCEISTLIDTVPETVTIGGGSFFADGIYFCGPRRHRGTVTVADTRLGSGTFLGNHAVVPAGHDWPDDLFVGVSTVADPAQARPGTGWFGHPPMELPRREVAEVDRRLTHSPGPLRYVNRLFWESLRFALPVLPLLVGLAWYAALAGTSHGLALAPLAGLVAAAVLCLAVVVLKWFLLGRVRPGRHPLWSCWCSRWDFLYVAWGVWAGAVVAALEGTLLLNAYLRLVGVRIGRRVVLGSGFSQVVDPDMLVLGDGATVTGHIQAHSFEDRVLKTDVVTVGAGATVGFGSVLFYGATIGEGATVAPESVVMKYDVVHAFTDAVGCPASPRD
jgi:non-ribosomal peptide synthetase-like protein